MDWKGGIQLNPVVAWTLGNVTAHGFGIFKLDYLPRPGEPASTALTSPNFAMTAPQLRKLGEHMIQLADELQAGPLGPRAKPKH